MRTAAIVTLLSLTFFGAACAGGEMYQGTFEGFFNKTQAVGIRETLELTLKNTGDKPMPNAALELEDYTAWVIESVVPPGKNLGEGLFSFGRLDPGGELNVTITLVPKDAGNFTIGMTAWGDVVDYTDEGLNSYGDGEPIGSIGQNVAIVP